MTEPGDGVSSNSNAISADALSERIAQAQHMRVALMAAIGETRLARSLEFADDEHDPDGSTASLDQARDAALLERIEQTLVELAAAQRRLAAGTYGVCEACGQGMSTERLLARPEARRCVACAVAGAARQRRRDRGASRVTAGRRRMSTLPRR